MEIRRDIHLNRLITRKGNRMIKVVTGIRRCGKSYLLFMQQGLSAPLHPNGTCHPR